MVDLIDKRDCRQILAAKFSAKIGAVLEKSCHKFSLIENRKYSEAKYNPIESRNIPLIFQDRDYSIYPKGEPVILTV